MITSRSNSKIKQARALRWHKHRRATGLFLVEGIRHVGEAVEAGIDLEEIFYAPDLLNSKYAQDLIRAESNRGLPCYATTPDVFKSIATKENPSGILVIAQQRWYSLEDLNPANFPWGVALVAPQDPGNIGAILRTINAVGASGLLLLDSSADPYHPNAVRASMGTLFWHPMVRATFNEFLRWGNQYDYHLIGTSAHAERHYLQVESYQLPLILLMGSEREGLTVEQAAVCKEVIRLPMHGRTTSLNLAVATGVILYSLLDKLENKGN